MSFHARILILSDDVSESTQVNPAWSRCLKTQGNELVYCYSVTDLVKHVMSSSFDLIFVDIHKPSEYIVDVIKYIRQKTRLVIWSLIEEIKDLDVLMLLKAGADNCLKRNTNKEELITRIDVFFRRKELDKSSVESNQLQLNSFLLCREKRELYYQGELVNITGIEFELLNVLMTNHGKIVSREDIAENIFKRNLLYCSRSINMHISNIRRKLRIAGDDVSIKSVRGNGYIFFLK